MGTEHWASGGWTGDWGLGTGDRKLENKIQATVDRPLRIYPPASHLPRMKTPGRRVHLVGALPVSLAPVLAACATLLAVHYPKKFPFSWIWERCLGESCGTLPASEADSTTGCCQQRGHCGRCQTASPADIISLLAASFPIFSSSPSLSSTQTPPTRPL